MIIKAHKNIIFGVFITLLVSSCVSVVPGTEYGGRYCVSTKYTKIYKDTVKFSKFSYGRYKGYPAGVNGLLCGLYGFHVLDIYWETLSGVNRKEEVNIGSLIAELIKNNKVPRAYGNPKLEITINDEILILRYLVYDLGVENRNKNGYIKYNLLNKLN